MADRVLVIEDDDRIRAVLRMALEDEGYEVAEASSGEDGVVAMRTSPSDFLIVDLTLGGMDGFACIREVRRWSDGPIVVVTARTDTHDVVAGLEAGADDYVTKPFQVKEITARLRALRRRLRPREGSETAAVVLSDTDPALVLRQSEGRLLRGDEPVHLTLTEFRLLCELAENPGQVLIRRQLLERVWEHGFFGDERLVDVHVRRLRTKIEEDPGNPGIVLTVRGLGVPAGDVLNRFRWRGARVFGRAGTLRSRIVLALTAGGLAVCALFALATYSVARGFLLDQRHRSALRQAYADANFLRSQLATAGTTPVQALAALSPAGATAVLVERNGRWSSSLLDEGPDAIPQAVREEPRLPHLLRSRVPAGVVAVGGRWIVVLSAVTSCRHTRTRGRWHFDHSLRPDFAVMAGITPAVH